MSMNMFAERFLHALGVGVAVAAQRAERLRSAVIGDDVDDFLLRRSRQIGDRAVDRLLFHLRNFLHRQVGLAAIRRGRFLVALDELAAEPAEDVVGDGGGVADVGVLGEADGSKR